MIIEFKGRYYNTKNITVLSGIMCRRSTGEQDEYGVWFLINNKYAVGIKLEGEYFDCGDGVAEQKMEKQMEDEVSSLMPEIIMVRDKFIAAMKLEEK